MNKCSDMDDLREKLASAKSARRRIIWTDGIFSMEGDIAKLPEILELARTYDAVVVVDDSHATGVLGAHGRGTAEHYGVVGQGDVMTSTPGRALGGAAGGWSAGASGPSRPRARMRRAAPCSISRAVAAG